MHRLIAIVAVAACSSSPKTKEPSPRMQEQAAAPAVDALRVAQFEPAATKATEVLAADPTNAQAAATRALARYITTLSSLRKETEEVVIRAMDTNGLEHPRMRAAMEATLVALAEVRKDLDVAAKDNGFALELCLACWERDWNHNGEIDESDRLFLQLELDAAGEEIPSGDPRRRPTFRFDVGDIHWARAMVAFQSAFFEVLLAYQWSPLVTAILGRGEPTVLRLPLQSPERIARAKELVLAGIDAATATRAAYLAETDDDREWVPNPTQKNHPLPLPVDAALYTTWEGVLSDLRDLVAGDTALSVAELAQLGDNQWTTPPGGFIDVGQMLSAPKTIVIDIGALDRRFEGREGDRTAADIEVVLAEVLGSFYVKTHKASPIVSRLSRMKNEIERDEDTLERKLRYLLWLN